MAGWPPFEGEASLPLSFIIDALRFPPLYIVIASTVGFLMGRGSGRDRLQREEMKHQLMLAGRPTVDAMQRAERKARNAGDRLRRIAEILREDKPAPQPKLAEPQGQGSWVKFDRLLTPGEVTAIRQAWTLKRPEPTKPLDDGKIRLRKAGRNQEWEDIARPAPPAAFSPGIGADDRK